MWLSPGSILNLDDRPKIITSKGKKEVSFNIKKNVVDVDPVIFGGGPITIRITPNKDNTIDIVIKAFGFTHTIKNFDLCWADLGEYFFSLLPEEALEAIIVLIKTLDAWEGHRKRLFGEDAPDDDGEESASGEEGEGGGVQGEEGVGNIESGIIHNEAVPQTQKLEINTKENSHWLSCNVPAGACWVSQDIKPIYFCTVCEKLIEWRKVEADNNGNDRYKAIPHDHKNGKNLWDMIF